LALSAETGEAVFMDKLQALAAIPVYNNFIDPGDLSKIYYESSTIYDLKEKLPD
jgi:hypothetical protein